MLAEQKAWPDRLTRVEKLEEYWARLERTTFALTKAQVDSCHTDMHRRMQQLVEKYGGWISKD